MVQFTLHLSSLNTMIKKRISFKAVAFKASQIWSSMSNYQDKLQKKFIENTTECSKSIWSCMIPLPKILYLIRENINELNGSQIVLFPVYLSASYCFYTRLKRKASHFCRIHISQQDFK